MPHPHGAHPNVPPPNAQPGPALGILTRAPHPGTTKTRLARVIGNDAAAALATAMLQDTVQALHSHDWRTALFVEPGPALDAVRTLTGHPDALPQTAGDIGRRMQSAAATLFDDEHRPVVLVGTDIPALRATAIHDALRALAHNDADVVFGPAHDGGYYLIGLNQLRPGREARLFHHTIAWSTDHVLARSEAVAAAAGLRAVRIETLTDIDTAADLADLRARLNTPGDHGPAAGPRTRALAMAIDLPADD
ncbi:MAG: hypothetical protein DK306_000574 [Chloroflexi bacterium]|nr:MAG: hypothetical protein DK306_000574 [Chloroflexota bacterium]